jgi:hypothetical protein
VDRQQDALTATARQKAGTVSFLTAIAAFREIGPVYLKAKQAQVEATANGALVSTRRAQLDSWLALAFFDL